MPAQAFLESTRQPTFCFLFAIFVLILNVFFMSIHISQLESKIKELVQVMALEEKKYEEEKR